LSLHVISKKIAVAEMKIAGWWKWVEGDKGEAVQKDPRHGACVYGWGEGSGKGLD
jgi:hypothetical protein